MLTFLCILHENQTKAGVLMKKKAKLLFCDCVATKWFVLFFFLGFDMFSWHKNDIDMCETSKSFIDLWIGLVCKVVSLTHVYFRIIFTLFMVFFQTNTLEQMGCFFVFVQ